MADVKMNITVNKPKVSTYRAGGKTLKEVKNAMDSREEWGLYDSTQNFKSSAKVDGGGSVVSLTMVLNPIIEMPAWSGYSGAKKEQKTSWDTMYTALLAHENRHHDIQLAGIEELKKAIKAAKTLDGDGLNGLIDQCQKSTQKKQDDYDTRSGHGAKEGVVLDLDADDA